MNYFAHGYQYIDDPYFLAGTAVPDWLSVVDRRVRARRRLAEPFCSDKDGRLASLAAGIVQHHDDDRWFHATRAFAELNLEFAAALRERLAGDDGMRPMFLGHLLIEVLLDAVLIDRHPQLLSQYYRSLELMDPAELAELIQRMTTGPVPRLAELIGGFRRIRFLCDYQDDTLLHGRVDRVLRRVGLKPPGPAFADWLPAARRRVVECSRQLLPPPHDRSPVPHAS